MPAQEAQDLLQAIDAFGQAYEGDETFAPVLDALAQVAEQVTALEEGGEAPGAPDELEPPSAVDQPPGRPKSYPAAEKVAKHRMRNARMPQPPK